MKRLVVLMSFVAISCGKSDSKSDKPAPQSNQLIGERPPSTVDQDITVAKGAKFSIKRIAAKYEGLADSEDSPLWQAL